MLRLPLADVGVRERYNTLGSGKEVARPRRPRLLIEQQGQGAKPAHPSQNRRHFQRALDFLRP